MIRFPGGQLYNGGILAARLQPPRLSVTARDRWTVTGSRIDWLDRGVFAGAERYLMRLPLPSGALYGMISVSDETLTGEEALWTE